MNRHQMKKNLAAALLILLILLTIAMGAGALAETVIANRDTCVFESPSKYARTVSISAGTTMEKTGAEGSWVRVEKNGYTAYVPGKYVDEVVDCGRKTGYVTKETPMYKKYGSSKKYGNLPEGAAVTVYNVAGDWAYASWNGYKGYVKVNCLSTTAPEKEEVKKEETSSGVTDMHGITVYVATEGAKVYKSYSSSSKVIATMSVNDTVSLDAVANGWARVEKKGYTAYMLLRDLSTERIASADEVDMNEDAADRGGSVSSTVPSGADEGDGSAAPARGTAREMDWWTSDIQNIFARGTTATITDVATGIAWKEVRKGGKNHADVQPATAADTAAMKKACGKWSWDRRAIFVTINGVNYAASMNCMPHGSGSIKNNNFDGHHCIYFTNSRGHASNKVCSLHQAAIQRALKANL